MRSWVGQGRDIHETGIRPYSPDKKKLRQPCRHVATNYCDLGQWLCVPPFR